MPGAVVDCDDTAERRPSTDGRAIDPNGVTATYTLPTS
jgi:hypothetical protein